MYSKLEIHHMSSAINNKPTDLIMRKSLCGLSSGLLRNIHIISSFICICIIHVFCYSGYCRNWYIDAFHLSSYISGFGIARAQCQISIQANLYTKALYSTANMMQNSWGIWRIVWRLEKTMSSLQRTQSQVWNIKKTRIAHMVTISNWII